MNKIIVMSSLGSHRLNPENEKLRLCQILEFKTKYRDHFLQINAVFFIYISEAISVYTTDSILAT